MRHAKPHCVAVAFHWHSFMNSSHDPLDPPELDELLLLLLPDVDESLQADGVVVVSAVAERSASATSLRLLITSIASHGFSGGIRPAASSSCDEFGEKCLLAYRRTVFGCARTQYTDHSGHSGHGEAAV